MKGSAERLLPGNPAGRRVGFLEKGVFLGLLESIRTPRIGMGNLRAASQETNDVGSLVASTLTNCG